VCRSPSYTQELWTADIDAQLHRACTVLAEECPASAARCAADAISLGRICVCWWQCKQQHSVLTEACLWWTARWERHHSSLFCTSGSHNQVLRAITWWDLGWFFCILSIPSWAYKLCSADKMPPNQLAWYIMQLFMLYYAEQGLNDSFDLHHLVEQKGC